LRILFTISCFILSLQSFSQDSLYLKVHFLYGSKPKTKYRAEEAKWFGGKWGGHVGIEVDSNQILNFLPKGKFHWIEKKDNRHSTFAIHSFDNFYQILGNVDPAKKTIFYIPITHQQKDQFDSIKSYYLNHTPYDYALFGMRCGAAAYDILGQLNIVKSFGHRKTFLKIF
jgi:hypothetical protein